MTTTFETSKVGDRVWCIHSGWGEIRGTQWTDRYPISVYFPNGEFKTYTVDGLYTVDDITQTLFWDEVVIQAPVKPMPDLEVDTKVLVWFHPEQKHSRHFSHFSDGKIYTFDRGRTSFTIPHDDYITGWDNWELSE